MNPPSHWQIQPQEKSGDYMFSGRLILSKAVKHCLSSAEISHIIRDLFLRVRKYNGADYIQTFKDKQGRTILCVDQLSHSMKNTYTKEEMKENDFWMMMFANEH